MSEKNYSIFLISRTSTVIKPEGNIYDVYVYKQRYGTIELFRVSEIFLAKYNLMDYEQLHSFIGHAEPMKVLSEYQEKECRELLKNITQ